MAVSTVLGEIVLTLARERPPEAGGVGYQPAKVEVEMRQHKEKP